MAVILGKGGKVKVGGVAVAEVLSWDWKESAEVKTFSAMGDTHQRALSSLLSASGSLECHWDKEDVGQDALVLGASVTLSLYPEGDASGARYIDAAVIITEIGRPVARGDEVMVSFSFVANGEWTAEEVA